jgi:hypothetical protein
LSGSVDAGKPDLHCVVLNADGHRLVLQRVAYDKTVVLDSIPGPGASDDPATV